jgi:hypothetical protein
MAHLGEAASAYEAAVRRRASPRAPLAFLAAAALLLGAASLPRADAAAASLRWSDVREARCEVGTCRAGLCGFRDCATPVSCRGGGCLIVNSASPTCEGGGCRFVSCASPTCSGGGCDFASTTTLLLSGWCSGGGCTIDGHAPAPGGSREAGVGASCASGEEGRARGGRRGVAARE